MAQNKSFNKDMEATFNGYKYQLKESQGTYPWLAERENAGEIVAGYGNTPKEACEVCEQTIREKNCQEAIF